MTDEYPSPDNMDFERMHDNVYRALMVLFDKTTEPLPSSVVLSKADFALDGEGVGENDRKAIIVEALRSLVKEKKIKKTDDGWCHAKKIPKYRSIDDPVSPYVFATPKKSDLPTKQEIIDDVGKAVLTKVIPELSEDQYYFSLDAVAKAWTKIADPKHVACLIQVFGIGGPAHGVSRGKMIFAEIMEALVKKGIVCNNNAHAFTYFAPKKPDPTRAVCHKPKAAKPVKKQERFRSLDDEWL